MCNLEQCSYFTSNFGTEIFHHFVVKSLHSTVTDFSDTTKIGYVPVLTFIYECKTNRFVYHKKELIESCEYKDFDIKYVKRG